MDNFFEGSDIEIFHRLGKYWKRYEKIILSQKMNFKRVWHQLLGGRRGGPGSKSHVGLKNIFFYLNSMVLEK